MSDSDNCGTPTFPSCPSPREQDRAILRMLDEAHARQGVYWVENGHATCPPPREWRGNVRPR